MPRLCYRKYRANRETLRLVNIVDGILTDYAEQGFDITLRTLYYIMIARDLIPDSWISEKYNAKHRLPPDTKNTELSYHRLGNIVARAREGGLLDWNHMLDRSRIWHTKSHWDNPSDFLTTVSPQFGIDCWKDQPKRVEVWVEKDALIGIVQKACIPLDVPYFACKGYISSTSIWEAAHNRLLKRYSAQGQGTVIIHLGDHDPSGIDMTRDIQERIELFSRSYRCADTDTMYKRAEVSVHRIALNMSQIKEFNPPPNPAKETDPRAKKYVAKYGDRSWELDAIVPPTLVEIIQKAIRQYLTKSRYDALVKQQTEWRKQLVEMSADWIKKQARKKPKRKNTRKKPPKKSK